MVSNHSPYFLKPPKPNAANYLIFQPEFPVFCMLIVRTPWLPFLSAPRPRVSFRVPLACFLSRYPLNGELYCRLNEGDIGRYPIP